MIRVLALLLLATWSSIAPAQPAQPAAIYRGEGAYRLAPRTALVIGVPAVRDGSGFLSLKNPGNDALAVAAALHELGFTVFSPNQNLAPSEITRQAIKLATYDFALMLKNSGGVGLVYYSGHGVEKNKQLFLAPYDAYVRYDRDLSEELVPTNLFYDAFEFAGNALNFLIVDSCRDFPWNGSMERFGQPRGEDIARDRSSVIRSNSTISGSKAPDGDGNLSPFAAAFIDSLKAADANLFRVFVTGVNDYLARAGLAQQTPTFEIAGAHDFVFRPTIATYNQEMEIYKTGKRENLKQLMTVYAGGYFYRAAREYLEKTPLSAPVVATTVALGASSRLRETPSSDSPLVEARAPGTLVKVVGEPMVVGGREWISVATAANEVAYVVKSTTNAAPVAALTFSMEFTPDPAAGAESLTPEKLAYLREALAKAPEAVTRVDVVGYAAKVDDVEKLSQKLARRQAVVVQALIDARIDRAKINLQVTGAGSATAADSVSVTITSLRN